MHEKEHRVERGKKRLAGEKKSFEKYVTFLNVSMMPSVVELRVFSQWVTSGSCRVPYSQGCPRIMPESFQAVSSGHFASQQCFSSQTPAIHPISLAVCLLFYLSVFDTAWGLQWERWAEGSRLRLPKSFQVLPAALTRFVGCNISSSRTSAILTVFRAGGRGNVFKCSHFKKVACF